MGYVYENNESRVEKRHKSFNYQPYPNSQYRGIEDKCFDNTVQYTVAIIRSSFTHSIHSGGPSNKCRIVEKVNFAIQNDDDDYVNKHTHVYTHDTV